MFCTDCKKIENRPNVDPKLWGKKTWAFIWASALSYPEQPSPDLKGSYLKFLNSLHDLLPCSNCRLNCQNEMNKVNIDEAVASGTKYRQFVIQFYNDTTTFFLHIF